MAAKNNCIKRDVCIFAKESFCKSNSECGHYIMEKGFTSTNTARDEICPVTAVQCEFGRVKVVCIRQGIFCHHVGQTSPSTNTGMLANAQICQDIVEDQLDYLIRIGLDFKEGEKDSIRDSLYRIVAGKLQHT